MTTISSSRFRVILCLCVFVLLCGFGQPDSSIFAGTPPLLRGIWDGMQVPWVLLGRFFLNSGPAIYDCQNGGSMYDLGFLIGTHLSIPLGWMAAIASVLYGVLF